jgi:hypothetical protein
MDTETRPFLTIVDWPPECGRDDVARLLAEHAGFDEATMRLRLGKAPPMIVGQFDTAVASRGAQVIVAAGGDAFLTSFAELRALGPTLKIRELAIEKGNLAVRLWRGLTTTIRREQIQILIRAHLSSTTRREIASAHRTLLGASTARDPGAAIPYVGVAMAGGSGLALGFALGHFMNAGGATEQSVVTSDKLDIHTTNGSVYQIDGDKFGYGVLGSLRGHSDRANMDAMCELLTHLAPNPIVDTFFPLWKPPPVVHRLRLPDERINNDDPAFAFYSRWAALMYRHVVGKA